MTFVDTSGLYAILDRNDENHVAAAEHWVDLIESDVPLLTTNYVLVESCALLQNRLGVEALKTLEEDVVPLLRVEWIDQTVHGLAMSAVLAARRRKLSLVDCTSFIVMRRAQVRTALAFDKHFREEGFRLPE